MHLVREYLELYLEHLSGEAEIERLDYSNLEDTTVMVTFQTALGESDNLTCIKVEDRCLVFTVFRSR